jgi:hypothetical protein
MGGVFNLVNLHLYHYAGNNPVKYIDPDGETPKTVLENQIESATNAIGFLYQKMEAAQKIGIGVAKLAMGVGIAALGVGGGGVLTFGSGGTAISDSVAVAQEAIIAGGLYVGAGIADVLDDIVMMSQSNGGGSSGNMKHLSKDEIEKRTGSSVHEVKDVINQQFGNELKQKNIQYSILIYMKTMEIL